MNIYTKFFLVISLAAAAACNAVVNSSGQPVDLTSIAPVPEVNTQAPKGLQTAVFAGGCFWGVEAVFEHVKGVTDVRSGYSGGDAKTAKYDLVSGGKTEHAEAVQVIFDPAKVTYVQLLTIFFSVVHDPTQLNRQGPDTGPQYRSAIFYANEEQKKLAASYIDAIDRSKAFTKPVVTQVVPLKQFFEAEAYHQDYLVNHPNEPYIVINDAPKVDDLRKRFPDLYVD